MHFIKCTVFRPSGKYYTDEYVPCTDSVLADYQIPDEVRKNRLIPDMFYVGMIPESGVPFLVKPE